MLHIVTFNKYITKTHLFNKFIYTQSVFVKCTHIMLEFWFDSKTSILKKLAIFVVIAIATVLLYRLQPLAYTAILMFVATGVIFLICRYCKLHFAAKKPTGIVYRLLTWIPIALLLALIFKNMNQGEILIPGAQGIGFMALAVCLFSPLALLHNNTTQASQ